MAAPWDGVLPRDQFFFLVTGANSGIGLGIAQRLIDWFLNTRSLTSHLILITTTRSKQKSRETTETLSAYARHAAASNRSLRSRAVPSFDPASAVARIHLLSVQLDLCKLPSVYAAAELLINGPGDGTELTEEDRKAGSIPAPIPRLDSVIFNAGIGGWSGMRWLDMPAAIWRDGITHQLTWPSFKISYIGNLVDPLTGRATTVEKAAAEGRTTSELLGETFSANLFGHYMLAHALLPLLLRTTTQLKDDRLTRARVVWVGSVTPDPHDFEISDFQAVRSHDSYESTKRLADILFLTAELPRVRHYSGQYLGEASTRSSQEDGPSNETTQSSSSSSSSSSLIRPRIYITHPGIIQTTIFQLNAILVFFYRLALYIARWVGSPWHGVTPYNGACAPVWAATEDQERLDSLRAERVKWGSSTNFWGECDVKRTEVEGWGWDGRVASNRDASGGKKGEVAGTFVVGAQEEKGESNEKYWLSDQYGRKKGAVDLVPEALQNFEDLGVECWKEMERLRLEWEEILGKSKAQRNGKALAA